MALPKKVRLPPDSLGYFDMFEKESDRAAAVLAASYLEAVLEEVLRTWLPPNPAVVDAFFDPLQSGFLSTLSAKKNMAYALGLVSTADRKDLQVVANVRNFFAHHVLDADSLDSQLVKDSLRELSFFPYPREWNDMPDMADSIEWLQEENGRGLYLFAAGNIAKRLRFWRVSPSASEQEHQRRALLSRFAHANAETTDTLLATAVRLQEASK